MDKKKVLIIIAFRNFRDEEYFIPKEEFEKNKIEVATASNQKGIAIGADGGEEEIKSLIEEVNLKDFDAVVFIGGPGCLENLDNQASYNLAQEAVRQGKILAAICISPVILAKAGVLKGKKATVWSSDFNKNSIKIFKEYNVIYQDLPVVFDKKIITAFGPKAAKSFAQEIIKKIKNG